MAIRIEPRLTINTADAAVRAAIDGMGIVRLLSYQTLDAVTSGKLVTVLDELAPPAVPVHLVYQASRRASINVRTLIESARLYFNGRDLSGVRSAAPLVSV